MVSSLGGILGWFIAAWGTRAFDLATTPFGKPQWIDFSMDYRAFVYLAVVSGAGNETTSRLIGWAGKVLADHPDQRRELAADPALIPAAIEESLRL